MPHMGLAKQRVRNAGWSPNPFVSTYLLLLFEWITTVVFPGTMFVINTLGLRYKPLAWESLSLYFFHLDIKQGLLPKRPQTCPSASLTRGKGFPIWTFLASLPILLSSLKVQMVSFSPRPHDERECLTIWETSFIPSTYFCKFSLLLLTYLSKLFINLCLFICAGQVVVSYTNKIRSRYVTNFVFKMESVKCCSVKLNHSRQVTARKLFSMK